MIFYWSVLACVIKSSNLIPCNLEQIFLLYNGPLFNQSRWLILLVISYSISWLELVIHEISTWCKISFNTYLVMTSSYSQVKEVSGFKPVYFLQLIHFKEKHPNHCLHNSSVFQTMKISWIMMTLDAYHFALYFQYIP